MGRVLVSHKNAKVTINLGGMGACSPGIIKKNYTKKHFLAF